MAAAKKTATKSAAKKVSAKRKKIVLDDAVLWAVVRKSWFGGGVVHSVYPTEAQADLAAKALIRATLKTFIVQRAPYVADYKETN